MAFADAPFHDFVVYSKENLVTIQWRSSKSEPNLATNYCIQRSSDGKTFETLLCVYDQGLEPDIEEFIETDFNPLPGWSYYRIVTYDGSEVVAQSAMATIFYGLDRIKKGMIITSALEHKDSIDEIDLSLLVDRQLIFVLRNGNGEEFFIKSNFNTNADQLFLGKSEEIPNGIYRIVSCSNDALNGLEISVDR